MKHCWKYFLLWCFLSKTKISNVYNVLLFVKWFQLVSNTVHWMIQVLFWLQQDICWHCVWRHMSVFLQRIVKVTRSQLCFRTMHSVENYQYSFHREFAKHNKLVLQINANWQDSCGFLLRNYWSNSDFCQILNQLWTLKTKFVIDENNAVSSKLSLYFFCDHAEIKRTWFATQKSDIVETVDKIGTKTVSS